MAGNYSQLILFILLPCFAYCNTLPESTPTKITSQIFAAPEADSCALLYQSTSPDGINATQISIRRDQRVANVEEWFQSEKDGATWSPISSFIVRPGCSLTACNLTDFDGLCKTFHASGGATYVPSAFGDFRSTSCACAKECKCTDVHIRKTGCGRAYLGETCNSCTAYYTDLKGRKDSLLLEFRDRISSIVVRPGCTLTVYDDEEFDGDNIITIEGVTNEQWKGGQVASYECSCPATAPEKQPPNLGIARKRPANYPPEIAIPATVDEVSNLTVTYGRHKGLLASLKSYKRKRSLKNAYILLLGLTGAGKSSAINLLFDNDKLTQVGNETSTTSRIHEFRVPVPIDELGIANSELRIIDTPGLPDTNGLERDARFLATLDEYLSGHEELSHRIPNIVLVFGKFHDNRYSGKGSSFVKMLNGLELFRDRLTDKKFSNVIFVLSHFMSETAEVTRRPTSKLRSFKKVIEEFSLFPKPISIVVAENKAESQGLTMLNGYFKLPNGEFYPRNLFDKIQQILTHAEDPIGEAVIRLGFKDSDNFNITGRHFTLVESDHGKAIKYLSDLSGALFEVEQTEVSQILAQTHASMADSLKANYPEALPYLQRALNLRNIRHKTDVPRTTLEIVDLLKSLKQNDAVSFLLQAAFGLSPPTLKEQLLTGHSYNLLEDKPLTISPFKFGDLKISDTGYKFPNAMSCEIQHETKGILRIFGSREEYVKDRLQSLGEDPTAVPVDNFTGVVRPGCNVYSFSVTRPAGEVDTFTLSAVREHRTFELLLNDKPELTPEFSRVVQALPQFNASDLDTVDPWKSFFATYGTHVVKSTHGGGSIEIQVTARGDMGALTEIAKSMFQLIQFAEDLTATHLSYSNDTSRNATGIPNHVLKFKGGNVKYHATDLTSMGLGAAAELLEKWRESVDLSPAILTSDMRLLPISQVAKKLGQNISSEIERAARLLLNSTLNYKKPTQIQSTVPQTRTDTQQIGASHNEFGSFLQVMMTQMQKSDERFQQILAQMQQDARDAQIRRDEAAEEERKWQRKLAEENANFARQAIENEKDRQLKRDALAAEMDARDKKFKLEMMNLEREQARRHQEAMARIAASAGGGGGGSCLKAGTKILTWNGAEVPVENLHAGDWVVGGDLNPTQVLGVSHEFILNQSFYGFDSNKDDCSFFTDTHLFVGGDKSTLHAADPRWLYSNNPLMAFLDVQMMSASQRFIVNRVLRSNVSGDLEIVPTAVQLNKSTSPSPPDTLVYFLQVSNPVGTYFANGYMARHEIPPFHIWPRTMAVLFTAQSDPELVKRLAGLEYTLENVERLRDVVGTVDAAIRETVVRNCMDSTFNSTTAGKFEFAGDGGVVKNLDEFDMDSLIGDIFGNPALSTLAMGVYGRSGKLMAQHLDFGECSGTRVGLKRIEEELVLAISSALKSHSL